jgi:hypothetical protein
LTFTGTLDPSTAEDVDNYRIVGPGAHHIKVRRAVYDPVNQTVTLHFGERLSIHHPYRLTVIGTGPEAVSNPQHQLLDSQAAGQPGRDDHIELTWRQLVLGKVSEGFLIRYHILPKDSRGKVQSGDPRPKINAAHLRQHGPGLFTRSVSFPLRRSDRYAHHGLGRVRS